MQYKWLFVILAGGLGAFARWKLSDWEKWELTKGFPWSLLFVNLLGCFFFGLVYSYVNSDRFANPDDIKLIILTGFMGAFTTYSTFAFETMKLLQDDPKLGIANIASHVILGIFFVFAGTRIGLMI